MISHIQPFLIPEGSVSPGGKAAIGLRVNGEIAANCIGSGESLRDAKACALRHVRILMAKIEALDVELTDTATGG